MGWSAGLGAIELAATGGEKVAGDLLATLAAVAASAPMMEATIVALARRHNVHILAGSGPSRRADGRFTNAARLITPTGRVGIQEKMIMTPFEVSWGVVPGDALKVFDTQLGRVGIAICYDCEFPLLVRAQAEAGAEVILIPSCTERLAGFHRVRAYGLLHPAHRHTLERLQLLLDAVPGPVSTPTASPAVPHVRLRCPDCQTGSLIILQHISPALCLSSTIPPLPARSARAPP